MKLVAFLVSIFFIVIISLLFSIGTITEAFAVAFSLILFALPGYPIYNTAFKQGTSGNPEGFFLSAVIGYCFSCFTAVMLGYFIKWDLYVIAGAILVLWAALLYLQKKFFPARQIRVAWEKNDYIILLSFLFIAMLAVWYPFLNVGKLTNNGYAYAHLFGHDFILRVSFSASIAHGIPPDYLNFTGTILPTYWLFYVFPSFVYLALGTSASLQNIMLITQIFCTIMFIGVLYSTLRTLLKSKYAIVLSMFTCICAYSYYDFYVLLQSINKWLPDNLRMLVEKYGLAEFSGLSHSIFRVFLLEPQAILALSLILVIILLLRKDSSGSSDYVRYSLIALLMAFSMGIDAFIGIIIVLWSAISLAVDLFEDRKLVAAKIPPLLVSIMVFTLIFTCYYLVRMYEISASDSGILFKPYNMIILLFPFYYMLEFGPVFIFGVLGGIIWKKSAERSSYTHIAILAIVSLIISLSIRHNIEINLGIRKGGYVLYIPLIIFCGIFFDHIFSKPERNRKIIYAVIAALALALPTLFTDINVTSNINDKKKTTYVSIADYKACQWIKRNTPNDSVVQSEPEYQSIYEYSLIPCFAERAAVVSESKRSLFVRIPDIQNIAEERKRQIRNMFSGQEIGPTLATIREYGIDFIYFGPYEQKLYPIGAVKFDRYPDYFEKVYSLDGVRIYKVASNL